MSSKSPKTPITIDTFYDQILRSLYYLLFFLTPIVMWTKTSEVFEFNKMLFVYLITILVGATWVIKSLSQKKFQIARTPLDIPLLLFVLSQIISTFLSIDRHTSLWGYYSRFHGGLMSTLSYTLLFYAFVTHFKNQASFLSNLLYTTLASAILVSLYGILEHFGIDKNIWVQDVQNRVFSTLGQPNWLSTYLLSLLPLSLITFHTQKDGLHRLFYGATSFILLLTILYTKSRSSIGTTFIILFLYFIYDLYQIKLSRSIQTKRTILLTLLSIILTLFVVGTPWTPSPATIQNALTYGGPSWSFAEKYLNKIGLTSAFKPVQVQLLTDIQKREYEQTQKGIRVGGSDSMEIRRTVWAGAIELVKRYPLFGTGVDTFGYSYYWVRPQSHNLLSEWDFLYNRAHNEYLNFAATTGLVGLVTYLSFIMAALFLFYHSHQKNNPLALPLALGFLSILITNYFGFSVVCVALFFFLFPAFLLLEDSRVQIKSLAFNLDFSIGVILVSALSIYLLSGVNRAWQADLAYNNGKNALLYGQTQFLKVALDSLTKATQINPAEPLYSSQLAEAQAQAALVINQNLTSPTASLSAEERQQYLALRDDFAQKAVTNSQAAVDANPYQLNFLKSQAKVALFLAVYDQAYDQVAIKALLLASEKAPTDPKLLYNLALIYQKLGQKDNAQRALKQAIDLKPDYLEAIDKLNALTATPSGQKK